MDVRFPIDMIITLVGLSFFIPAYDLSKDSTIQCGFPGSPKYGRVNPEKDDYEKDDIVTYSCSPGHILLGRSLRRCTKDGTWTDDIPVCDVSMTTLGTVTSTPILPGSPAEFAIDGNRTSCTYLKEQTSAEPRSWEIDLGQEYKILSVAVSRVSTNTEVNFAVYVIKVTGSTRAYKKCATFTGKFGTQTILLSCAEGKGIKGSKVHLQDIMQSKGLFEICEVEVQVEKDTPYECGEPDRKPYSITSESQFDEVQYSCKMGYRLEGGPEVRTCMRNGQWSGQPPTCEAIVCEPLDSLENGQLKISVINGDIPLQGAVANYMCDNGYKLNGSFSRICDDNGVWSGKKPKCEAIRCPVPDGREFGGIFRLVNKTTRMGSMAVLKCRKGKREGDNPFIHCNEEGDWTEPNARCLIPARAAMSVEEGPRIVNKGAVIFGMVVAGIMITVVFISIYVVMQRRRNGNKPELPSRQIEAPEAPPRPPPRSKGAAFLNFVSRKEGLLDDKDSAWKTRSLPMDKNEKKEAWPAPVNAARASSYDQQLQKSEPVSRTASPQTEEKLSPEDPQTESADATEAEVTSKERSTTASPEAPKEKADSTASPKAPAREYAAVDYEKKRQSRLLKEQSSEDGESDRVKTPTSVEENEEDSTPPVVPPKDTGEEDSKKPTAEEDAKPARGSRRTDTETQPESEPENKQRRPRRTRAQVETPEPEPDSGRRTRRTRGRLEDEG